MTESLLQKQIQKEAKKRNVFSIKVESVGRRGFPDLYLIAKGKTVLIEVKHPNGKGKLSALQSLMHDEIRAHGGEVRVIDDLEKAITLIDSML